MIFYRLVVYGNGIAREHIKTKEFEFYQDTMRMIKPIFRALSSELETVEGDDNYLSMDAFKVLKDGSEEQPKLIRRYYWTGKVFVHSYPNGIFSWKKILEMRDRFFVEIKKGYWKYVGDQQNKGEEK